MGNTEKAILEIFRTFKVPLSGILPLGPLQNKILQWDRGMQDSVEEAINDLIAGNFLQEANNGYRLLQKGYDHLYRKEGKIPKGKIKTYESAFNRYTYVEQCGMGGSGTVIKVKDQDENTYAIKYLNSDVVSTDRVKRFKNELYFCIKNQHENIIKINDYGYFISNETKCPFYVMPYYPMTLRKLITDGIEISQVLLLFSQILNGVEVAHLQNIWHRDLKPENILFNPHNKGIVIADFGIAHFEEEFLHTTIDTRPQERLANFQYAAPEQRQRGGSVNHLADIYALGLILNEMFTKVVPIGTNYKKISDINTDYKYLDSLVDLMLSNLPEKRPDSIGAIKRDLIAKGNQFIIEQKLSNLKKTVIPQSEIDDPLVIDPPQLKEVDYRDGVLELKLDKNISDLWAFIFQNPPAGYSWPMGLGTHDYKLRDDIISVSIDPDMAQKAIEQYKIYAGWANGNYKKKIQHDIQEEEKKQREQLRIKIKKEEERQNILKNIKI